MKLISHRGNLYGPNPTEENNPDYVCKATAQGFYAEVDIWLQDNKIMLGHDEPKYEVSLEWLMTRHDSMYLHCKNVAAFLYFKDRTRFNTFYHDTENYVITSNGETIVRETGIVEGVYYPPNCIFSMPETANIRLPYNRSLISDYAGLIYNFDHEDYDKVPEIIKFKEEEKENEPDNIVNIK